MSDAVRWGVLSTADINDKVLRGAAESDRVEVLAVGSRDAGRAEAYARRRGIERSYGSYEELLADPDVEAVYISLPNSMHVDWSIRALEAGKHVLCEKPLSRHPQEVERAFDAADGAGRILMEAFMWRHNPQTKRLKELVDGGAIGRLRLVRAAFSFPLSDTSNVRLNADLDGGGAHGRRVLLRLRRPAPRRRARAGVRRAGLVGVRRGRALRRDDALPRRRPRRDRLRARPPGARRARGDRRGGLALSRRSVALPEAGDRASNRRRRGADRARARGFLPPGAREPRRRDPRRRGAPPRPRRRARPGTRDRGALPRGRGRQPVRL